MTDDPTRVPALARAYADFFEALSPESLPALRRLVAPDLRFHDPLHAGQGSDGMEQALRSIFRGLDEPRFTVTNMATSGRMAFIAWNMTFRRKGKRGVWNIDGVSTVTFDAQDRVAHHVNHWNAGQLYEQVPVLGSLIRTIRRQVVADARPDAE